VWLDITVRVLLSSTLVMAQAILLNWLRVPFAAITLFAGIAAYGAIAGIPSVIGSIALLGAIFLALIRPLPQDRYLLLSLAALALVRSAVGSINRFGGQLGAPSVSTLIPAQRPTSAFPYALTLFLAAFLILLLLRHSQMGLAVDVARIGATDLQALSMAPVGVITTLMLGTAVLLASFAGTVQGAYAGWVDPNLFRIDYAITMLVATLVIGRMPIRGALLAMTFFIFPDLFSAFLGYNRTASAHVREILWGAAIIVLAGRAGSPARGEQ
jgi:ABC-type branched-subunit amino acid transport system permease subunit